MKSPAGSTGALLGSGVRAPREFVAHSGADHLADRAGADARSQFADKLDIRVRKTHANGATDWLLRISGRTAA